MAEEERIAFYEGYKMAIEVVKTVREDFTLKSNTVVSTVIRELNKRAPKDPRPPLTFSEALEEMHRGKAICVRADDRSLNSPIYYWHDGMIQSDKGGKVQMFLSSSWYIKWVAFDHPDAHKAPWEVPGK